MMYETEIRDFRIWFEYTYLHRPVKLIADDLGIMSGLVCKIVRTKHARFLRRPIPDKWMKEEIWVNDNEKGKQNKEGE